MKKIRKKNKENEKKRKKRKKKGKRERKKQKRDRRTDRNTYSVALLIRNMVQEIEKEECYNSHDKLCFLLHTISKFYHAKR